MKVMSIHKAKSQFLEWRRKEKGAAEIYAAIIILPVLASMIFMLLEVGIYIHYRGSVDSILQTTVRGISLEAGDNNPRTNMLHLSDPANASWITRGTNSLIALCANSGNYSSGRCQSAPVLTCSSNVIPTASQGTQFSCTAVFDYRPVSPLSSSKGLSMGMSTLFTKPITIIVTSSISGGA